jgi:phosphonate transport system substrate-binding protein
MNGFTSSGSIITTRGHVLAEALSEATGLAFQVGIVDDEAAMLQLLCDAPADTIGFMSAEGYVLAAEQCAAEAGLVAQGSDDGLPWQAGMLVTRRDSGLETIADLDGLTWAVASPTTSGQEELAIFHYFQAELAAAGVEPGEIVTFPEDSSALLAVLNSEADFAAAAYVPPILPFGDTWTYGEDTPELWRSVGIAPQRSPIGYVLVNGEPESGGYRLRDARARLFDVVPTIFDETEILGLSQPVPNQTIVFGAALPAALVRQVTSFLEEFGASEACADSLCASDWYGWVGLQPAEDGAYDSVRFVIEALGLTAADLGLSAEQGE